MTIERMLLIRHGETDWNIAERWQGIEQTPLNDEGLAQALALAHYLRRRPITAIYSSDLMRAWQTAATIGDALRLTPQANADLREHHLGIFQGLTRHEIEAQFPQEWAGLHADYYDYVIPNGESRRDVQTRMYRAWETMLADAQGPEAAVVSHGGAIKVLLLKLFGETPALSVVRLPNTCITIVERNGRGWELAEIGATPHLQSPVKDGGETREM